MRIFLKNLKITHLSIYIFYIFFQLKEEEFALMLLIKSIFQNLHQLFQLRNELIRPNMKISFGNQEESMIMIC